MIDRHTVPDISLTWEITDNIRREIANEKCRDCHWQNADTCRACGTEHKTMVLAVNKSGIKGG